MKSTKPYLIRAIHEWCADQGFTPYLAVKVDATTRVPREFVKDGEIVLNVGLEATHQLLMGNEEITFQARFGGRTFPVVVPIERVSALYARENGEGMAFEVTEKSAVDVAADSATEKEESHTREAGDTPAPKPDRAVTRPFLTRVK
ncbi:MAG: ClpXP protease specificity-enhancing factor [Sulfuritalea sp.]|nr:ClpXP protease specificity-enhancing factor [Sulfuritalea sp.]